MNGAQSLVRTLVDAGVEVCFANPGTSEMHFVASLEKVPQMRCVLGLFEGVVTGAADGYYRMAGKPASTLLHLGPGLGNGLANLHNAKKARSGIVNIVGEHATHHLQHDAPLTTDIEAIARPMSDWVRTSKDALTVAADGAAAVAAASGRPGKIATLIMPADAAWTEARGPAAPQAPNPPPKVGESPIAAAVTALRKGRAALLLGGEGTRAGALEVAGRIAAATDCAVLTEYAVARVERGAGRVEAVRLPYGVAEAVALLKQFQTLVLVGTKAPVAFFAYPNMPSLLADPACDIVELAGPEDDITGALDELAKSLGAQALAPRGVAALSRPGLPTGPLTPEGIAAVLCHLMPVNAIVVDEAVSRGRGFGKLTSTAAPHDWLTTVGGAIGFGLPAGVGAAIAAPDRPVVVLEGDGSAMYTLQSLWTMARESLDVKILVFANRSYQILRGELMRVGADARGAAAQEMLSLERPTLDWLAFARAQGLGASRADTLESLAAEFRKALATPGPYLVEVVL
ncbi:acetolactate synthase large subunit [Ramlibacter sp.]|uniref:acetolactate synthase large subunit n=1 Tax=Ramlibacter sp. TaxID=1917967 RepID=UPI003D0B1C01